jgi:hypothetical protein
MNIFERTLKNSNKLSLLALNNAIPEPVSNLMYPPDNKGFIGVTNKATMAIMSRPYKETNYKEIYCIDASIIKYIESNKIQLVRADVLKTEDQELKISLVHTEFSNSWISTKKEANELAEISPIRVERDKVAQVYVPNVASDVIIDAITKAEIEQVFEVTFKENYVDSLSHPILEGKLKADVTIDVDDEFEDSTDTDAIEKVEVIPSPDDSGLELDMSEFNDTDEIALDTSDAELLKLLA